MNCFLSIIRLVILLGNYPLYNQYGIFALQKYYQTIAAASSELRHEEKRRSMNYDDFIGLSIK